MHGSIWKERGLLTTNIKDIKHKPEILDLLQAILDPTQVTGVHCLEHLRENTTTAKGNRIADKIAKEAAKRKQRMSLIPAVDLSQFHPEHSASDQKRVEKW